MKLFGKLISPAETETQTDPEALVDLLDERFPDRLPEANDRALLEAVAPDAVRALGRLRRRRILDAAGELPLQGLRDGITAAADTLRGELTKHADVGRRIEALKGDEARLMAASDADPLAAAHVRGEIQSLEAWLARSSPLQAAVDQVCDRVDEASRALLAPAAHQSVRDGFFCRLGAFEARHPNIASRPVLERSAGVLGVADKAVAQLKALLEGRVRSASGGAGERVTVLNVQFKMPSDDQE
jgi:hypothetical protein